MPSLNQSAFSLLQHLIPKLLMTRAAHRLSRVRHPAVKDFLINRFVSLYDVDIGELEQTVPSGFDSLNDFFTRSLPPSARPIDAAEHSLVSPADGSISAIGKIHDKRLLQAKGQPYTLAELLATDIGEAEDFVDGLFLTIYLAPYNYHRVHAPFGGELVSLRHVPGSLYSVNQATAATIPRLFCRNERLICRFRTGFGTMAVVLVGALNVGSITTPWTGEMRARTDGLVQDLDLPDQRQIAKGDLIGWFNLGSTVIVLLPPDVARWNEGLLEGHTCRVGAAIGRLAD